MYEQLTSLRQDGSFEKYVQEYEQALACLSSMTEEQCLGYFMNDLKGEIKQRVRIHKPKDLS